MPEGLRERLALLGRTVLLLLVVYSGLRGLFLLLHGELFRGIPGGAVAAAFVRGLRFDLSAIAFSNLPFLLLALAPDLLFRRRGYRRLLKWVFVTLNSFFLAVMVADLEYFTFTGTRATFDLLQLTTEAVDQLDQLVVNYAPLVLLAAALGWLLHRGYPVPGGGKGRADRPDAGRRGGRGGGGGESSIEGLAGAGAGGGGAVRALLAGAGAVGYRLAIVALVVIAARGGLQKKVLQPMHAFAGGNQELGLLTLNSTFTLLQSPLQPELEPLAFFASDEEARALLEAPFGLRGGLHGGGTAPAAGMPVGRTEGAPDPRVRPGTLGEEASGVPQEATPAGGGAGPNVVVLILESFATEFWGAANGGEGYTPFLDTLVPRGIFLSNNFANGRRSIDALPSILLGVPGLAATSVAQSSYQGNQWKGLGHLLGAAGYHTSFFHGAPKGTMYFDAIAAMAGIAEFHPLESYPREGQERDFDGNWGLYDEPFLQHVAAELGRQPTPFFSSVFTISTHQPYGVPPEYEGVIPEGELEIHRSVRYVDLAVQRFFERIQDEPWFDNTLFIITGDHTQPSRSLDHDTFLGRYMVPLLLFHPGMPLPEVDPERITQHVDLFPTILDVAGVEPGRVPAFGRSVFAPVPGEAILRSNGVHWLVRREGVVQRNPGGEEQLFDFQRHRTRAVAATEPGDGTARALGLRLRAHLQHFNNSLIRNSFYRGEPASRQAGSAGPQAPSPGATLPAGGGG